MTSNNLFRIRGFSHSIEIEFPCQRIEFSAVNWGAVCPKLQAAIIAASQLEKPVPISIGPLTDLTPKAPRTRQAIELLEQTDRLEFDISALLAAYCEATGLTPTSIDLQYAPGALVNRDQLKVLTGVKVTVGL
jgi:hypothetical protein